MECGKCGTKNRVNEKSAGQRQPVCGKCGAELQIRTNESADDSRPIIITDVTFSDTVANAGNIPLLVDCWAPWCGPCRVVGPVLDQLASESKGKYRIGKLNVDENPRVSAQFAIQSIPTMLIFKQGKLVDRLVGAHPKPAIAAKLQAYAR